jgi:hypothetical protein
MRPTSPQQAAQPAKRRQDIQPEVSRMNVQPSIEGTSSSQHAQAFEYQQQPQEEVLQQQVPVQQHFGQLQQEPPRRQTHKPTQFPNAASSQIQQEPPSQSSISQAQQAPLSMMSAGLATSQIEELYRESLKARDNAYCPYPRFNASPSGSLSSPMPCEKNRMLLADTNYSS